jgi:excinuclease ABC subunit C
MNSPETADIALNPAPTGAAQATVDGLEATHKLATMTKRTNLDPTAGGKRAAMPARVRGDDDGPQPTPSQRRRGGLEQGIAVLREETRRLPAGPGVYRMLNRRGDPIYVGKAHSLKKRVAAYLQIDKLPVRLKRMVAETAALEVVSTHTEVEALLLESNLIKRFLPRYNVLLRDDKSFPYILITGDHPYPRITKHRGARARPGQYFGPFASAGAVNRTITALEKAFLLRSCSDSVFRARTRPCLLYQIKRCSAPCVGRIGEDGYRDLVDQTNRFLTGESNEIQATLAARMEQAADNLDFETAAVYRDRIRALTQVQARQDINVPGLDEADVVAAHLEAGQICIQVFFFRAGRNYGNRAYFPSHDKHQGIAEVMAAFLGQFYDSRPVPRLVLLSHAPEQQALLEEALSLKADHRVELRRPQRGDKRKLIDHALANAREALARRLAESSTQRTLLEGVAAALGLDHTPERIEVYDNSHIQGSQALGAMIVAGPEGFRKAAYRKFNIRAPRGADGEAAPGGDDYAMMREVLQRRFARALKEDPDRDQGTWPDLVLIDGGQGQLGSALQVVADLGIDDVALCAIAKGPDRDAGRERFFMPGRAPFRLEPRDPVLYFLQRLRDEAHRFAIGGHRTRRAKDLAHSSLDDIPGVGARRKRALLHHFGSARAVARAGLPDLQAVEGISGTVAQKVYEHFHGDG